MVLQFLLHNWIEIIFFVSAFFFRAHIKEAILGGNGKAQMDEFAKLALVLLLMWTVYVEGTRPDMSQHVFSETFFGILISGVFAIAGLKTLGQFKK